MSMAILLCIVHRRSQWAIALVLCVYAALVIVRFVVVCPSLPKHGAHDVMSNIGKYVLFTYCVISHSEFGQRETF